MLSVGILIPTCTNWCLPCLPSNYFQRENASTWQAMHWCENICIWVCIGMLQYVACVEGLVLCFMCVHLSGSMCCACVLSGQYPSRSVQGRLAARAHDLWGRGMTENLSGNLQLQLETLELYQSNLNNSAFWKILQRTNPFLLPNE